MLREQAAGELARAEWDATEPEPDPLALRVPQLAAAEEAVAAARTVLARAEEDLANTEPRSRSGSPGRCTGTSSWESIWI